MGRSSVRLLLAATALAGSFGLVSCATAQTPAEAAAPATVQVTASVDTMPTARGEAGKAVIVVNPANPAASRIVATAGLGGLEVYDLEGRRQGAVPAGEAGSLDVRHGFILNGRPTALLAASDTTDNSLRFFAMSDGVLSEVGARAAPLGFAVEGVCFFRNAADGGLYVVAVGDGGEFDQRMVFVDADGRVDSRQSRRLGLPSPAEHCVGDDVTGQIFVSEQAVGLWRFNGDPETDATPVLIDAPRLGRVTEELGGVALFDGGEGARYLIVSDASSGRLFAYDRGNDDAWIGAVSLAGKDGVAVGEPGGLFALNAALGSGLPGGALIATDEDAEGGANYKVVSGAALTTGFGVPVGTAQDPARVVASPVVAVTPLYETTPVLSAGDAADDPAIWANPNDPAASLIVATDKKSGLYLYDMQGRVLQHLPDGKMNNVDLRTGFMLGGQPIVLVTASDRTHKAVAIYRLDTEARQLVNISDGVQAAEQADPYGQCMYRSATTGKTYVFINDSNGEMRQWELIDAGNGRVRAQRVRDFAFNSQAEGCVADDAAGILFADEEDIGIWRIGAEPDAGSVMTSVDTVEANPAIKDDLEGIGLYDLAGGRGYLIVSSQGNNTYAVYRREGTQEYLGSFAVVADPQRGIDGISETDGLEVSSANLGPGFEHGALIAQDGRNVLPGELQNYKYVPWQRIAEALNLEMR
ncbi:phytase [Brevundimonas lenta]|uniref:3-phytase n=1 Tax=Brevundimonas lenta TaxID=424796 RepID=A0A7W6JBD3_9CAUL|nr:phytase [Brevundimonas lenta]MBB4081986.1 3-phytase [Brevundimonas lenta]